MKFGGTSVGGAQRIAAAATIVKDYSAGRPTVVVVSAMSGVTDLLVRNAQLAARGDEAGVDVNLATLRQRHYEASAELLQPAGRDAYKITAERIFGELENTLQGVLRLGHCPARANDAIIGCGERLSTPLLAATVAQLGIPVEPVDATSFLVTDENFGEAAPLMEPSMVRGKEVLLPLLKQGVVPIVTGFIGTTLGGAPTTLGRGGSDYSASIAAACLDAAEVWIWTDVEGIFSADPNLVPEARALASVTYQEAAELSFYGAKVLHPKTLAPLADRGIPVYIKNSFAPEKTGTLITRNGQGSGGRAVTSLKGVVLITIESRGELSAVQLIGRTFTVLGLDDIDVLMLSQASREESFCFAIHRRDQETVLRRLQETFHLELKHGYILPPHVQEGMGVLALVGSGMRGAVGVAERLFAALAHEHINVAAIAQGSSETNISVVIEEAALASGVRAVHRALVDSKQLQAV
jgi:aspartokinase/homoserine dehydrogenase 1